MENKTVEASEAKPILGFQNEIIVYLYADRL